MITVVDVGDDGDVPDVLALHQLLLHLDTATGHHTDFSDPLYEWLD